MRALPTLLLALFLAVPVAAQSLPSWGRPTEAADDLFIDPNDGVTPGAAPAPVEVPVDGGLGLLALAGGAYAARRLRSRSSS